MRGLNRVFIAGHVTDRITFSKTHVQGADACTFIIESERPTNRGSLTVCVKINVYIDGLVEACRGKLEKGCYVLVEGELMNRDSPVGRATEIRAWELSFFGPPQPIRGGIFDEPNRRSDVDPEP